MITDPLFNMFTMVNSDAFAERLKTIMEYYGINASSFADEIGVQRSGISHILAGRNKPSLDFVLKVLDAFKEIDLYWLLIGKGTFPPTAGTGTPAEDLPSAPAAPELPEKTSVVPPGIPETIKDSINPEKGNTRRIVKIILLYENGSFDSFEN